MPGRRSMVGMWGLPVAGLVAAAVVLSCASKGPPEEDQEAVVDEEAVVEEIEEETVAGRSPESMRAAERLGLQTLYFEFDSYVLRDDAKASLRHNYDMLRAEPEVRVEIQGNCDERGSEEYNLALGERRAHAAREYLVRLGIAPSRISTVSFGENNPAVAGHNESAWARNRRDDFAVRP